MRIFIMLTSVSGMFNDVTQSPSITMCIIIVPVSVSGMFNGVTQSPSITMCIFIVPISVDGMFNGVNTTTINFYAFLYCANLC